MTAKRFTMCHEQNDLNGWTMSIIDWETKQPFDYTQYEVHSSSMTDTKDEMEDLCLLLNELHEQVEVCKEAYREIKEDAIKKAEENKKLKKDIKQIHTYIDNAILTERTRMGKNCLKQLKEGLQ